MAEQEVYQPMPGEPGGADPAMVITGHTEAPAKPDGIKTPDLQLASAPVDPYLINYNPDGSQNTTNPASVFYKAGASTSPVQNTSALRVEQSQNSQAAQGIYNDLVDPANYQPFQGSTAEVDAAAEHKKNTQAGIFTTQEQQQIDATVEQTKAQWRPLIEGAEQQKAAGLPKDIVEAGQRGGFMSTQYAGVAALLPTQGGDFVGAGGLLSRISSDYDRNIATVTGQMNAAVTSAKQAAITAIKTGAKEDLKDAQDQFDRAQKAYYDGLELKRKYVEDVAKAQDRAVNLRKQMVEEADQTVSNLIEADLEPTEDETKALAKTYNMSPDAFKKLISVRKEAYKKAKGDASAAADVDQAKKINDITSTLPAGQPITINGHTYYGTKGTGTIEVGSDGYGTMLTVDPLTGAISLKDVGFVGLPKDGWTPYVGENGLAWSINKTTGEWRPIIEPGTSGASHVSADWTDILPNGSTYTGGRDKSGQCGVLVNDMTGIGFGDSIDSKKAKIDTVNGRRLPKGQSLGDAKNPLQIGDAVVMSGGTYGHVAVINSISVDENGVQHFTLTEQNWKTDGKGHGLVDNTRTVSEDDPSILGYARGSLKPQFQRSVGAQVNVGASRANEGTTQVINGIPYNIKGTTITPLTLPDGTPFSSPAAGTATEKLLAEPIPPERLKDFGIPENRVGITYGEAQREGLLKGSQIATEAKKGLLDVYAKRFASAKESDRDAILKQAKDDGISSADLQLAAASVKPEETVEPLSVTDQISLRKEIKTDKRIVDYIELAPKAKNMHAALDYAVAQGDTKSKAAADQALVVLFNKMLDPGSSVREGEYARTADGQSLIAKAEGYWTNLKQGGAGITDDIRRDMVAVADKLLDVARDEYGVAADEYGAILKPYGATVEQYVPGYAGYQSYRAEQARSQPITYEAGDPDIQLAINEGWAARENQDGSVTVTPPRK